MSWLEQYKKKLVTPEDAVSCIKSNMRVHIHPGCAGIKNGCAGLPAGFSPQNHDPVGEEAMPDEAPRHRGRQRSCPGTPTGLRLASAGTSQADPWPGVAGIGGNPRSSPARLDDRIGALR